MKNVIKIVLLALALTTPMAFAAGAPAGGETGHASLGTKHPLELVADRIAPFLVSNTEPLTFSLTSKEIYKQTKKAIFFKSIFAAQEEYSFRQIVKAMTKAIRKRNPQRLATLEDCIRHRSVDLNAKDNPFLHLAVCLARPATSFATVRFDQQIGLADRLYNVIRLLVRHGASLNLVDIHGQSALDLSLELWRVDLAELLISLGATCSISQRLKLLELQADRLGLPRKEDVAFLGTIALATALVFKKFLR
jgi:hypothetical protein